MKIAGICFTQNGYHLLEKIEKILRQEDHDVCVAYKSRFSAKDHPEKLQEDLKEWVGKRFLDSDAVIFIGATGITVRTIAPYVKDKRQDPAVIVLDESGKFCIPLLSGHIGGANDLAVWLADRIHAVPVVTTATDINDIFAVDVYAKKNHMTLSNMTYAKEVSASLLSGYPVGFQSDFPVEGALPSGFVWEKDLGPEDPETVTLGVSVSPSYKNAHFDHCLWLIPKCITIGIGCRKGATSAQIADLVRDVLKENYLYPEALSRVATIDRKAEEPGLLQFCRELDLPMVTYTAEELNAAKGKFTPSRFVKDTTGVDNVCERCAMLAGNGEMIVKKTQKDGVTCACVFSDWRVSFE